MIREHSFNSAWWGAPVGIVNDPAFFELPGAEQNALLAPYAWAEHRQDLAAAALAAIMRAGFVQADTQLPFRLGMARVAGGPSLDHLDVESAAEAPFRVGAGELAPFEHERYGMLPGITPEKLASRYARWANEQIAQHPDWCLRIRDRSGVQGWFLSRSTDEGLNLELAMLRRGATISGMYLYQKAIVAYAAKGARIGYARFSISNTPVLNIYSRLGAQFLAPMGIWIRVRG
ncbi:MAG TPA: hypothetical protein VEZ11_18945 [Thermoanaerobaculia bacterium]|nr:hypothetical protein [Thermoanaerobaculia bacterium]